MSKVLEAARAGALPAPARRPFRLAAFMERESVFSWLMLTPPMLFLLAFLGYPFFYGVYLSFFHKEVARVATFVAFDNFVKLYNDPIFWQAVRNTIIFTGVATVLIGWSMKSARSPPNMRRAERFIHSMPFGPTVTMPTSTESRMARVRSACSATACSARWRSSTLT